MCVGRDVFITKNLGFTSSGRQIGQRVKARNAKNVFKQVSFGGLSGTQWSGQQPTVCFGNTARITENNDPGTGRHAIDN